MQTKLNSKFSYSDNFLKKCLEIICVSGIVAFGDSHVQLLRAVKRLMLIMLEPLLLIIDERGASTGGRRKS